MRTGSALLRFDHRQTTTTMHQHVVGDLGFRPLTCALQTAQRDLLLATDATGFNYAPTSALQSRVDQFGASLGFVHSWSFP